MSEDNPSLKDLHDTIQSLRAPVNRPHKTSSLSRFTYYRPQYGLQFKAVVDQMMDEYAKGIREDRLWKYEDYEGRLSPSSLYLRIQQSRQYLLNELDPDGKYKVFLSNLKLGRAKPNIGVRLSYYGNTSMDDNFMPSKVTTSAEQHKAIHEKIDEFLQNDDSECTELKLEKLVLSQAEKEEIEVSLMSLENIVYKISDSVIWIKKI